MLVLTRKRSESVKIGDNIVIKVIQTGRGMVKLGIEAPSNVRVLRAELCEFAPVAGPPGPTGESMPTDRQTPTTSKMPQSPANESPRMDYTTDFAADLEDQMFYVATLVD
jgi:carbon storage regulator